MPAYSNKQVFDALKELGIVDNEKLNEVFVEAEKNKQDVGNLLIEHDLISQENLGKLISEIVNTPYIKLAGVYIEEKALHILPEKYAAKYRIICFRTSTGKVDIATSNPQNNTIIKMIKKKVHKEINIFFALDRDIEETLVLYKQDLQNAFEGIFQGKKLEDLPIEKILNTLLEYAYDSKASDIHVEPKEGDSIVRFRIDGELKDMLKLPKLIHDQIINKIKVECKLRTDEHLSAQDGKMQFKTKNEEVDLRISIVPTIKGENCVMRLLTTHMRQFGLNDLGFSAEDVVKVRNGFSKPYGMILSTGPTGSGKTTTMYSILKELNTRSKNITTIEDPVEYDIFGLNQIQINTKTNMTFAEGLRSILRQDPDIIYVGEIRDPETADIAVNSAMTGHLVLSTLHTNDAATSLPRLIDMNIEPFLVSTTVNVIVAQRLVRKICGNCKFSYTKPLKELSKTIADTTIKNIIKKHHGDESEIRLYMGKGCPVCRNSGYVERVGIFEVLEINENIRKLITTKASAADITKQAIKDGMTTMLEDGIIKALNGVTTIEEILHVTKD